MAQCALRLIAAIIPVVPTCVVEGVWT